MTITYLPLLFAEGMVEHKLMSTEENPKQRHQPTPFQNYVNTLPKKEAA
jgi:hypothetical protein